MRYCVYKFANPGYFIIISTVCRQSEPMSAVCNVNSLECRAVEGIRSADIARADIIHAVTMIAQTVQHALPAFGILQILMSGKINGAGLHGLVFRKGDR